MLIKHFKNKCLNMALMICMVMILCAPLAASHSKILTVAPQYSQEATVWCGPATAQMIMEGYPSGSCTDLQEDIWPVIVANRIDALWDTDPVGIEKAMESLCPPTYGWVVKTRTTAGDMMYAVARNMNQYNYPVALVMNTDAHNPISTSHTEHWVAVTGIVTDVDPVANSSAVLEAVIIHDPAHLDMSFPSVARYCTAAQWGTLFSAVNKPGSTYHGKFVAVMEPPPVTGTLTIAKAVLKGLVIKPKEALKFAKKWLIEHKYMYQVKGYDILHKAKPMTPMLVDREYGGYYLIPYALQGSNPHAVAAVLINAYNGNLKEVGVFKAMEYVAEDKAVRLARKYLRLGVKQVKKIQAEMVTKIQGRRFHLYAPAWKITLDGKVVHVGRTGKVFTKHLPYHKPQPHKPPHKPHARGKRAFSMHGGFTLPSGDFNLFYNPGLMLAIDMEYKLNDQFSVLALGGYNHFKAEFPGMDSAYWWNVSANLKLTFSTTGTGPYVNGGCGIYIPKNGKMKPGYNVGAGIDYALRPNLVFEIGVDYHHILTDFEDPAFYTAHVGLIFRY
jgi:opacity protein-like surface antigen